VVGLSDVTFHATSETTFETTFRATLRPLNRCRDPLREESAQKHGGTLADFPLTFRARRRDANPCGAQVKRDFEKPLARSLAPLCGIHLGPRTRGDPTRSSGHDGGAPGRRPSVLPPLFPPLFLPLFRPWFRPWFRPIARCFRRCFHGATGIPTGIPTGLRALSRASVPPRRYAASSRHQSACSPKRTGSPSPVGALGALSAPFPICAIGCSKCAECTDWTVGRYHTV
jgi:hypothetical protein